MQHGIERLTHPNLTKLPEQSIRKSITRHLPIGRTIHIPKLKFGALSGHIKRDGMDCTHSSLVTSSRTE